MDPRYRAESKRWADPEMNLLTREAMEALPTPRLLAYYKKLRECSLHTREMVVWETTMADAKAILDTREHVAREA